MKHRSSSQSYARSQRSHSFAVPARLRIYLAAIVAAIALGASAFAVYSPPAGAQDVRERVQRDLGQVFMNHEDIQIDPKTTAESVRASGRISLATASRTFRMQLRPNDLRAPGYRAEETGAGGITRDVSMPVVSTYKGNVIDVWGSDVRLTITDDVVEGMIVTPNGTYYVEPAQKFSSVAQTHDYVFYQASDVRPDITRTCGETLETAVTLGAKQMMAAANTGVAPAVFSPLKIVEIATDSDLEYTNALGGSAAANSDILSILNQIDAIYKRDIGLTFNVTFQHTWSTADPFGAGGTGAAQVLNAFTNYWNANFSTTPRDVAHLWTGKNLGGPAGVAWMGVVCSNPGAAYGISDRETMAPFRVGIPAHEIGHNFNADHCDGQAGCDNTIMVAMQTPANTLTFCAYSVNEITAYVNANSSCLSNAPAGNPIDDTDFFVRQHYLDFLGRAADQAGLDFWKAQITQCGANSTCIEQQRITVSASFFLSIEFQETGYVVERTYKTSYGDANAVSQWQGTHAIKVPIVRFNEFLSDTRTLAGGVIVGAPNWEQTLEANKVSYFNAFVQTARFTNAYPAGMLAATFVHTLNVNAGSPLSTAEETQLTLELQTGAKTRAQVLRQIAQHPNLAAAEKNRAFVLMEYFGYLRRNPDDAPEATRDYTGYDFWLLKLNQSNGDYFAAEMVKGFLSSIEYRQRFGTP
jgi:Metallo-peptidase family M12/Reprolysin family propeptide/Domain of unknown function (DUF4214)